MMKCLKKVKIYNMINRNNVLLVDMGCILVSLLVDPSNTPGKPRMWIQSFLPHPSWTNLQILSGTQICHCLKKQEAA